MKKKLVLTAAVIAALSVVSCNSKKTNSQGADQDSLSYAGNDSLNSNDIVLDSIAGTYEGTLPAADCHIQLATKWKARMADVFHGAVNGV